MHPICPHVYAAKLQPLAVSYYRTLHRTIPDPRRLGELVETMVLEAYKRLLEDAACDIQLLGVDIDGEAVLELPTPSDAVLLTWGYTGAKYQEESKVINAVFVGHRYNKDHYVKRLSAEHMAVVTVRGNDVDAGMYSLVEVDTHHPLSWAITRAQTLASVSE